MARERYDQELQELQDRLLALGSQVAVAVGESVRVLVKKDSGGARRVMAGDNEINRIQAALEHDCLIMIATRQPLARDLRVIAAVMALATELERIGDYAKGIAKIQLLIGPEPLLPAASHLPRMAAKGMDMLIRSLDAFAAVDHEAAYAIHAEDDEVDALYNQTYRELLGHIMEDANVMDQATHLLWAAHNLERTADRVSNICERIVFIATGELIEMPEEEAESGFPA